MGDFQSPSIFVPSYIIKDDTVKDDHTTASNPSSPNYIFPIDRSHSAMSLAAQSLTSQVSAVARPSAGYFARALRHQSGGSDHSGSVHRLASITSLTCFQIISIRIITQSTSIACQTQLHFLH